MLKIIDRAGDELSLRVDEEGELMISADTTDWIALTDEDAEALAGFLHKYLAGAREEPTPAPTIVVNAADVDPEEFVREVEKQLARRPPGPESWRLS